MLQSTGSKRRRLTRVGGVWTGPPFALHLVSAILPRSKEWAAHAGGALQGGTSSKRRRPPAAATAGAPGEELKQKQHQSQAQEDAHHPPAVTPVQRYERKKQRCAAEAAASNEEGVERQPQPVQRRLAALQVEGEQVQRFIDAFVPADLHALQTADGKELG